MNQGAAESVSGKHASLWEVFDDALEPGGFGVEGYEVLGELARGGMGVVYHAKQLKPEREVALKVMLPKYAGEVEMRERFQKEARAMATLDHPGILPVYEVGETKGLPFFSMKLASGGSMAERLKGKAITIEEAVGWMRQIAAAVHYAHQHGVLHRDLKPGNFLFDHDNRVYVGDFGVAKMLRVDEHAMTKTQAFIGTPYYMPPEVAGGAIAEVTVTGDLYSLGAVLYECLTGDRPHHRHENVASLLRAIVDEDIEPLRVKKAELPLDLEVICRKALEKDPGARYESVAAFGDDLERWQEGRPILARPVGWVEWVWRWMKRRPLPATLLCALLALAIVGGVLLSRAYYDKGVALQQSEVALKGQLLARARLERQQAAPGFRRRVLSLLRRAKELSFSSKIQDEAIAVLAKVDLSAESSAFDGPREEPSWSLTLDENEEVLSSKNMDSGDWVLSFHQAGRAALWKASEKIVWKDWLPTRRTAVQANFVPGRPALIVTGSGAGATLYEGEEFQESSELPVSIETRFFSISPIGDRVAFAGGSGLEVLDLSSKEILWKRVGDSQTVRCPPSWSRDGKYLAVALGEFKEIIVFDVTTKASAFVYTVTGWPNHLSFHPEGRFLAVACDNGTLVVIDLVLNSILAELKVQATDVRFSSNGNQLQVRTEEGEWRFWHFMDEIGYREWSGHRFTQSATTVFGAKLSPDEKFLLTITTEGIEIWQAETGRQVGFHHVENQRIDARTDAWWLPTAPWEILIQVPGGLERVSVGASGELGIPRPERKKVPGSEILDIRSDGTWLVKTRHEDGTRVLEEWPTGDPEKRILLGEENQKLSSKRRSSALDGQCHAEVLDNNDIQLRGKRQLKLILPKETDILQVLFSRDGDRLFGIGQDYRIFEWDLKRLDQELKLLGFD